MYFGSPLTKSWEASNLIVCIFKCPCLLCLSLGLSVKALRHFRLELSMLLVNITYMLTHPGAVIITLPNLIDFTSQFSLSKKTWFPFSHSWKNAKDIEFESMN